MRPIYNDKIYHTGKLGMKWGKRNSTGTPLMLTKNVNLYNKERNKDQSKNALEKNKLRSQYDNGKISYENYVKQHIQLGRAQVQKSLTNAKNSALSSMSEKEQKKFEKNTTIGKKQSDILLDKIARGGKASLLDKISLSGYK